MNKIVPAVIISSLLFSPSIQAISIPGPATIHEMLDKHGAGFASLEHRNLGDRVQLTLPNAVKQGQITYLRLPNGLSLSYGEIIMYGGDMFGDDEKPISSCKPDQQAQCFKAQFDALAAPSRYSNKSCRNPLNMVAKIRDYTVDLEKKLQESRSQGIPDWEYYTENDSQIAKTMNKITCGGSFISGFIPFGQYIKLAKANFDHFAPDSMTAYKAGHLYALQTARQAWEKQQLGLQDEANALLELAYAQNAFANHYLTDSFAAGHMRTPRRDIHKEILLPAVLKLLIANLMHNEDNRNGLMVVNAEGHSWMAYGDGYLFKQEASEQRHVILDAMQRSADGIYQTYLTGIIPSEFPEMRLFPDISKIDQLNNSAPLFKMENGSLLKRVDHKDPNASKYTKNWSGLLTLIEMQF